MARGPGEQAVVAAAAEAARQDVEHEAVGAARQDVEHEAADERVGGKGHDLLPVGSVTMLFTVGAGTPASRCSTWNRRRSPAVAVSGGRPRNVAKRPTSRM